MASMSNDKRPSGAGRTVLITGATSGIGFEIAMEFARHGWNVAAHCRSDSRTEELKAACRLCNIHCHVFGANLSSEEQVRNLLKEADNYQIDSLVNNAGSYGVNKHFSELTSDDITYAFAVNVVAPILLSAHLFTGMKERRFGRIVNISSIAAKYGGSSHSLHYGCSKRALEGLTKTLAREGAAHNVLVNTIRPGVIDTPFHQKFQKDLRKRVALIPVGRMGLPRDISTVAYYLGSEENDFLTSETIAIAGGE